MNDSQKIEARFQKIENDLEMVKSALNIKSFMKSNFTPDGVIHIDKGFIEKDGTLNPNKTISGMPKWEKVPILWERKYNELKIENKKLESSLIGWKDRSSNYEEEIKQLKETNEILQDRVNMDSKACKICDFRLECLK